MSACSCVIVAGADRVWVCVARTIGLQLRVYSMGYWRKKEDSVLCRWSGYWVWKKDKRVWGRLSVACTVDQVSGAGTLLLFMNCAHSSKTFVEQCGKREIILFRTYPKRCGWLGIGCIELRNAVRYYTIERWRATIAVLSRIIFPWMVNNNICISQQ